MKTGIHPTYHDKATITCSCGNVIKVGSTKESYSTELCSKCHPFYTGKQKTVDSAGRIEKFKAQQAKAAAKKKGDDDKKKGGKKKKSMEDRVNEALQKEREKEEKEDEKLKSKIKKQPVIEMDEDEAADEE